MDFRIDGFAKRQMNGNEFGGRSAETPEELIKKHDVRKNALSTKVILGI